MPFVHLRTHTEFSVVDGTIRIDDAAASAAADGQVALAITDLANLFGAVKFYKACRGKGVKPFLGADLWVEPVDPQGDKNASRLLVLVQDHQGYLNLCELLARAWTRNVQRAQAWGRTRRPDALSGVNTITADSLDIHMPAQIVRLVWAYGHARTTSRDTTLRDTTAGHTPARDTTVRAAPPRDTTVHDTTARVAAPLIRADEDWLTGDTLRADFGVVTDSSGAKKSQLDHLTSFGSAHALYHVDNSDHPDQPKGVNYSRGRRIDIALQRSKVSTVDVVGKVDGIYLEPLPPVKPDSAAADSLRRAGADTTGAVAPDSTRRATPDTTRRPPLPADTTKPRPSRP